MTMAVILVTTHQFLLTCYRVAVVDKVTDFVLFIGKLVVVGAMGE